MAGYVPEIHNYMQKTAPTGGDLKTIVKQSSMAFYLEKFNKPMYHRYLNELRLSRRITK
jgi:hypothetical protein